MLSAPKRPVSIFIFLFFLVSVNFLVNFFLLKIIFSAEPFLNDDYFVAGRNIYEINKNNNTGKIIIFGSSMGREGIDQEYLLNNNNQRYQVYNLSVSSGKPTDYYLMLKKISKKEEIKLAIVTLEPWAFNKKYTKEYSQSPGARLFSGFLDKTGAWENNFASLFNFYRYSDYFNQIIDRHNLSFWKAEEERKKEVEPWRQYKYPEDKSEDYFIAELQKKENYLEYNDDEYFWREDDNIQLKALKEFFAELEKNNIPSLVINIPVHPLKKEFYGKGLESNYQRAIASVIPLNGKLYDYSSHYEKDCFVDFNHLNEKGRTHLSQEIDNLIRKDYAF